MRRIPLLDVQAARRVFSFQEVIVPIPMRTATWEILWKAIMEKESEDEMESKQVHLNSPASNTGWKYRSEDISKVKKAKRGGTSGKGTRKSNKLKKIALIEEGMLKASIKSGTGSRVAAVVYMNHRKFFMFPFHKSLLHRHQKRSKWCFEQQRSLVGSKSQ